MGHVAGTDTVRGIAYQQAQAVLAAIDLLDDGDLASLRVEGVDDVVDIEFLDEAGLIRAGKQVKIRAIEYTWGKEELLKVLRRWAAANKAPGATFEFLTDGRLGPTGEDVQRALVEAADGSATALASLLGEPATSPLLQAIVGAKVRLDPTSADALLARAEGQVAARLPLARTQLDTQEQAARSVAALHRLLLDRASQPDPQARLVSREEVAACLGLPADQSESARWGDALKSRYLQAAEAAQPFRVVESLVGAGVEVQSSIRRVGTTDLEAATAEDISAGGGPAIVAGRTGSGKSTAVVTMRRTEAEAGRTMILAHAEMYLPGRLAALIADGLSEPLGEEVPSSTGRQLLADPLVTLVVDGASEVPLALQDALADDIRMLAASGRGARIVLVGRDVAALRRMLPTTVEPDTFTMIGIDSSARHQIALSHLLGDGTHPTEEITGAARALCAQAERALGDAAGNPLLFTMAIVQITAGVPFSNPAALYQEFIAEMAKSRGATDMAASMRALGIVFASLLNQGRRYADSYEWASMVQDACAALSNGSINVDPSSVMQFAERTGLVTHIGFSQTVVPLHDSFADFLAALAHAQGLAPLPARFDPGDEQRVMFLAELNGVDTSLAERVASELPYLTPRLAEFDSRELAPTSAAEVRALLRHLMPAGAATTTTLWANGESVVAAILVDGAEPPVVGPEDGQVLSLSHPTAVLSGGGPLTVAVRLWRLALLDRLTGERVPPPQYPNDLATACTMLEVHATEMKQRAEALATDLAPSSAPSSLLSEAVPLGLDARIGEQREGLLGHRWSVTYRRSTDVRVVPATDDGTAESPGSHGSSSTVESMLDKSPARSAAESIRQTINRLAGRKWI